MGQGDTKPCLGGCEKSVPIGKFTRNPHCKSGFGNICIECAKRKARERYWEGRTKTREISETDKDFFRLGATKADDQIRDLEKALNIQEKTIRSLVEVIKEADIRDAKRARIPA